MRKWFLVILAMLLIVVPLAAQEESNSIYLRVAHFSVDSTNMDVYVNEALFLEDIPFSDVSSWVELEPGNYNIGIVPTGASISEAVLATNQTLSAGNWATVAIIGESVRETLTIQTIIDDLNNVPAESTFISVFHAITDLAPVTVLAGDIEIASLLSYPRNLTDSDGYVSNIFLPGDYTFEFQNNGTSVLSLETRTLGAGKAYLLAVIGTASNPQYVLISTDIEALTEDEVDPFADIETGNGELLIRVGHFSVSAQAVDVYLNDEVGFQNVQFGDVSDYMEFTAGIYDVTLVPAGEAVENAIYEGQISLVTDTITLIAAVGFVENGSLEVVTATENADAPDPNTSRIAFFQAIPSLELFDLKANDNILIQGLTYPDAFEGAGDGYASVDIVADVYEFVVEGAGNTLNVGNVTTGSGRVYLVVSTGVAVSPIFFLISGDFPAVE